MPPLEGAVQRDSDRDLRPDVVGQLLRGLGQLRGGFAQRGLELLRLLLRLLDRLRLRLRLLHEASDLLAVRESLDVLVLRRLAEQRLRAFGLHYMAKGTHSVLR